MKKNNNHFKTPNEAFKELSNIYLNTNAYINENAIYAYYKHYGLRTYYKQNKYFILQALQWLSTY